MFLTIGLLRGNGIVLQQWLSSCIVSSELSSDETQLLLLDLATCHSCIACVVVCVWLCFGFVPFICCVYCNSNNNQMNENKFRWKHGVSIPRKRNVYFLLYLYPWWIGVTAKRMAVANRNIWLRCFIVIVTRSKVLSMFIWITRKKAK